MFSLSKIKTYPIFLRVCTFLLDFEMQGHGENELNL